MNNFIAEMQILKRKVAMLEHKTQKRQAENTNIKRQNKELLVLCGKAAEELRLHVFNREDPACEIVLEIRQIIANEKEKQ